MKKSMLAATVVATAFAASANAGWFTISSASSNGTGTLPTTGSTLAVATTAISQPGTDTNVLMSQADAASVFSAIGGGSLASDTIHYFGMETTAGGPGFFGFLFKASQTISLNVNLFNNFGSSAGSGVLTAVSTDNFGTIAGQWGTYASGQFSSTSPITINAGEEVFAIFGNLAAGAEVSGSISRNAGNLANFGVNYLSFNGSNYVSAGSATGATASNLNIAAYAVPVPAPALLAGAGLVGAAALRRRMAKKA